MLSLLGLGFILGLKHALETDHMVAVSTIISQTKSLRLASKVSILWGLGHTISLMGVGLLIMLTKSTIPPKLALSLEFAVGVMLLILGIRLLHKIFRNKLHLHTHTHDGTPHLHLHSHTTSSAHHHSHRSLAIGLLHGLAGSSALMLLVLSSVKTVTSGIFYILIFGFGSILGMLIVGITMSIPLLMCTRFHLPDTGVKLISACASITVGIAIIIRIGWTEELLNLL